MERNFPLPFPASYNFFMTTIENKTLLSNNQIKTYSKLQQKKFRDLEKRFLVEGAKLCREALYQPENVECVIFSQTNKHAGSLQSIHDLAKTAKIPVFYADSRHFKLMCDTQTPQGVAAVVKKRRTPDLSQARSLLALDGIQDPGNLGSILRTAEWFNIDGILSSTKTVDCYNPKVVRGTMGSIFRLAIQENIRLEKLDEKRKQGFSVIAAVVTGGIPPVKVDKFAKNIILVGSEASGISLTDEFIDVKITIPKPGAGESLNVAVATAILLYEIYGQKRVQNE